MAARGPGTDESMGFCWQEFHFDCVILRLWDKDFDAFLGRLLCFDLCEIHHPWGVSINDDN